LLSKGRIFFYFFFLDVVKYPREKNVLPIFSITFRYII
jgi:hypothetical protein